MYFKAVMAYCNNHGYHSKLSKKTFQSILTLSDIFQKYQVCVINFFKNIYNHFNNSHIKKSNRNIYNVISILLYIN